jgi:hypothetical protein
MTSPRQHSTPSGSGAGGEQSLERWLAPLRDLPEPTRNNHTAEAVQTRRAVQIQRLATLIGQVPQEQAKLRRRSQWRWGMFASAALAAAASTTFFLLNSPVNSRGAVAVQHAEPSNVTLRHLSGQVVSTQQGRAKVLTQGAVLAAGDELSTTAEAYASLDVGPVRIDLTSATTVELVRAGQSDQAYRLRAGRVDISVPHLPGESRRVEVITPDSVVKVKGTVFSVEVDNSGNTSVTRVEVTRGSVGVESSGKVHVMNAGDSWASVTAAVDNHEAGESGEAGDSHGADDSRERQSPNSNVETRAETLGGGSTVRPSPERSSLKDQNQLFSRALHAQRRGNHRLAVQLYSSLLKRYPDSPLAPTARTELEQAQTHLNNAQ